MKKLFTSAEYNSCKSTDYLKLQCYHCNKSFLKQKRYIDLVIKNYVSTEGKAHNKQGCKYCSHKCQINAITINEIVNCTHCQKEFKKDPNQIKKHPNHFCSHSCRATYNNTHKSHGTKRSKLERYLEEQLITLYPNIKFDFNKKDAISSELDIYIPTLKLAFELNGIYHYEPIHGQYKLNQIQNNDQRKFQACIEAGISLCIIDTSGLKYFKPTSANKFLNIIIEIINKSKN